MLNYLVYGEWQAEAGEMEQEITASAPDLHTRVHRCPWNTAWRENGLLPYGRYYCQEIDAALLRGFNPDLKLGVGKTQTNDGEPCEFVFYEARLVGFNKLRYLAGKSIRPGKRAHLPWGYHLGHLYKTVTEVISEALNPAEGLAVEEAALAEFASRYGQPAAQIVRSYRSVDFDSLPKRPGQLAEGG